MRGRAARLLALALGLGLAAWVLSDGTDPVQAEGGPASETAEARPEPSDYAATYATFLEHLSAFRAGADGSLEALREAAQVLADRHGRADAVRVVEYYASLSTEERRQGLADYERFTALWSAVQDADPATWPTERDAHLAELRLLIAEVAGRADFVPAGRALALAATIEARAVEGGLDRYVREELELAAARDAREALAIFERAGMQTPRIEPLSVLAQLDALEGEVALSEDGWYEVLGVAESAHVEDYRERALLALIGLARKRGDVHDVERLLRELASFRDPATSWLLAREVADRLLAGDQPGRAAEFLLRNRPLDGEHREGWMHRLALARLRQRDVLGARALLERLEASPTVQIARAQLALLEDAPADCLELLSELTTSGLPPSVAQGVHTLRGEALLEAGNAAGALHELREAVRLARSWERRLEEQDALERGGSSVFGEWLGLHAASLEARALVELGREAEAALAIERSQARAWRDDSTVAELRAWAERYEHGLLTWVLGADEGLAVWIGPAGETAALAVPHGRREVMRAVRRLRQAALDVDPVALGEHAHELGLAFLPAPLRARLATGDGRGRLLCLAHGALELLPLGVLRVGEAALDERAALLVLPELVARAPGETPEGPLGWNLLGDPWEADGSRRLPAAAAELGEIALLHADARVTRGADFTREALLAAVEEPRGLHIATHLLEGSPCDARRYSAVGLEVSGGGRVCAAELAHSPVQAPLIVLSACETAGGRFVDARGRQGIARALLDAGARNLLVTLWPVTDEAARAFTPRFHAGLDAGLTPARAAQEARRELAAAGVPAADWAAFRLAGRD